MKKKAIITTALVLAVALIGGVFWHINQPAPVEEPAEPAEPEGGEIAVNSEPQQDTPEPEADSEPEKEGDGNGELVWNEETGEFEPAYGVGNTEESTVNPDLANMTEEELKQYLEDAKKEFEDGIQQSIEDVKNGNFGSDTQDTQDQQDQQQGQGQGQQQQGQGGGQQQGQMTVDEVLKKLQEAGINAGYGTTDGGTGDGGGLRPEINW